MTRIRGNPGSPPGGQHGFYVNAPPPQIPCPPPAEGTDCPPCPPSGTDCGTPMIRGTVLEGSNCCTYVFWLSCAPAGMVGYWDVSYTNTDDGNAPVFDFNFWTQDPTEDADMLGDLPFSLTNDAGLQTGFSDTDGTLLGYAAYVDAPPGIDPDAFTGWAEACFIEITNIAGGFDSFIVSCIPFDPTSGTTTVDTDSPITLDITESIACRPPLAARYFNSYQPGNEGLAQMFTVFQYGDPCTIDGSAPAADDITFAIITSGTISLADEDACGGGCCFNDRASCNPFPTYDDDSHISVTNTYSSPLNMTKDTDGSVTGTAGSWYIAFADLGVAIDSDFIGQFTVLTDHGPLLWKVALSHCY